MLNLKFDKDTGRMIGLDSDGYPTVATVLKRRDTVAVEITLYSAGVATVFSSGNLSIGVKAFGVYSGALVAEAALTTSGTTYVGTLSLNTDALADLFAGVGLPPTEPAFVALAAEVVHSTGWTSESVSLRCNNDYITGDEPSPGQSVSALDTALAERLIFRSALTGGTTASLDGVDTLALSLLSPCLVTQAGALSMWQLQAWDGATATNTANGLVLPADANATTNPKIWVRLS